MFKTIAKIAGIYAVAEIAFHLGEGFMIGYLNDTHPEVGEEIHNMIEYEIENKTVRPYTRLMLRLVLIGENIGNDTIKHLFDE